MSDIEQNTAATLPLKNTVLFPLQTTPLAVGRPASVAAVQAALASEDKTIAAFAQKDPGVEAPGADDLYPIGTLAVIKRMARQEGGLQVILQGTQRVERVGVVLEEPYINARLRIVPDPDDFDTETEALQREVLDLARRALDLTQPEMRPSLEQMLGDVEKPIHRAYLVASLLPIGLEKEQALLAAKTQREALQLVHDYLGHEVQVLELREKIATQAQSEMSRQQREYVLRQQLRAIQEELGEQSPGEAEVSELRSRVEEVELPELVRGEVEKELGRLERMSPSAPDYQLTRTYVELVLELPWTKTTEDDLDLERARRVLDEDHFDLEDVKDRIIEHLAVMKLNPEAKSPILCFVGPPGVGKTSLGQSIARALGRAFERMSLGGLHDEAELRGHRRTYIGAMPGRIIRALRRAEVKNPLLMLDEVDKLGRDFRGDPAAALMEILDPAQNVEFQDNYLDLPFDLSKVFFIATANTLDTIPAPLLDRMEVLRLPGYSDEQKREIARRYLIERQVKQAGLSPEQMSVPDETLSFLIRRYTREAGVRELERVIGRIARKIATRVARGEDRPVAVGPEEASQLLGPERFAPDRLRTRLPPGVAAGLAWTEAGGEVLYVEAALLPGAKELTLTGQLGNVMQESAKAARSYLWAHSDYLYIDENALRESGVHIHVPAGATPKDGPSAGVTMLTALASLYSGHHVRSDTAMTGEITLSGLVLPVGGIKEKVLAAHRAGIRRVILPKDNQKDLAEVPEHVRGAMEFVCVERMSEALGAAIPELAERMREVDYA